MFYFKQSKETKQLRVKNFIINNFLCRLTFIDTYVKLKLINIFVIYIIDYVNR